ncbi:hypothetical protein [uncultured Tateyamaria sp.]|uniref:hypothetical protein n=1 Tax=uncultured Tateyamaria sp. TaxID=455651 RepID=UPI00261B6860|nr:hypothetical protein [uncultured Tateyamaria sp.]
MKKTLITSITAFAIVLSAGMSMAGPLGDHGFGGKAHDVRSSVSQAVKQADRTANTHQTTTVTGSSPSTQLPNVIAIPVQDDGSYTWVIGKTPSDGPSSCVYVRGGMTFC